MVLFGKSRWRPFHDDDLDNNDVFSFPPQNDVVLLGSDKVKIIQTDRSNDSSSSSFLGEKLDDHQVLLSSLSQKRRKPRPSRVGEFLYSLLTLFGSRWLIRIFLKIQPMMLPSIFRHENTLFYFHVTSPHIALTIDDSPGHDTETGMAVLDLFAKWNVKATFFIMGYNVRRYLEYATMYKIVEDHHELGNHLMMDKPGGLSPTSLSLSSLSSESPPQSRRQNYNKAVQPSETPPPT